MLAHEQLGGIVHGGGVELSSQPPGVVPCEHGTSLTGHDAISIAPGAGVKARREALGSPVEGGRRDVVRQQGGEAVHEAPRRHGELGSRHRNAHILGDGVHAGVRAARAREVDLAAQ